MGAASTKEYMVTRVVEPSKESEQSGEVPVKFIKEKGGEECHAAAASAVEGPIPDTNVAAAAEQGAPAASQGTQMLSTPPVCSQGGPRARGCPPEPRYACDSRKFKFLELLADAARLTHAVIDTGADLRVRCACLLSRA